MFHVKQLQEKQNVSRETQQPNKKKKFHVKHISPGVNVSRETCFIKVSLRLRHTHADIV